MTEPKPKAPATKPKEAAPKKEVSKAPEKKEEQSKSNAYYYPVNNYLYSVLQ